MFSYWWTMYWSIIHDNNRPLTMIRIAQKKNLTIDEFINKSGVVWTMNNIPATHTSSVYAGSMEYLSERSAKRDSWLGTPRSNNPHLPSIVPSFTADSSKKKRINCSASASHSQRRWIQSSLASWFRSAASLSDYNARRIHTTLRDHCIPFKALDITESVVILCIRPR